MQGLEFRLRSLGFRVQCLEFSVQGLGFRGSRCGDGGDTGESSRKDDGTSNGIL